MVRFLVSPIAGQRLDEIYRYTADRWGETQAEAYVRGLFNCFDAIARREKPWRAIPTEFWVEGFYGRYERHFIYWRVLSDGAVGIVTVLHEHMHQMDRFRRDDGQ